MALNITNELLDQFQRMPDEDVLKVYSALDEGEKSELHSAIVARNNGKLVGTADEQPAPMPNRSVGHPMDDLEYRRQNPTPGMQQNQKMMGADTASPQIPGKREEMNHAVTAGQEMVGLPIAKKVVDATSTVESPSLKVLGRDALTRIAGPKIQDYKIDPATKATGEQNLADFGKVDVGPIQTSVGNVARSLVTEGGNPVTWLPVGEVEEGASLIARLLHSGFQNATQEGISSLATNAPNPGERIASGFVGGVVIHGATEGVSSLARKGLAAINLIREGGTPFVRMVRPDGSVEKIPISEADATQLLQKMEGNWAVSNNELKKTDFPASLSEYPEAKTGSDSPRHELHPYLSVDDVQTDEGWKLYMKSLGYSEKKPSLKLNTEAGRGKANGRVTPTELPSISQETPNGSRNTGGLIVSQPDGSIGIEPLKSPAPEDPVLGAFQEGDKVVIDGKTPIVGQVNSIKDGKVSVTTSSGVKQSVDEFRVRAASEGEVLNSVTPSEAPIEQRLYQAVKNNPRMGLVELSAHAGSDPISTREILSNMEQKGLLVHEDGEWNVGKGKPPELPPAPKPVKETPDYQPGDYVYIEGRNGQKPAKIDRIEGGNAVVFTDKENKTNVPLSKLRSTNPPGIANLREVIPETAKFDGPPPDAIPANQAMDFQMAHDLFKRVGQNEGLLKSLVNSAENQRHRGPLELQSMVKELQAADQLAKIKKQVYESLTAAVPKKDRAEFFKDVHSLAEGSITSENMGQKYPEIWNEARAKVLQAIDRVKSNEQEIIALGGLPEDIHETRVGDVDQYVARKFQAYLNPEQWQKTIPAVVEQNAITRIIKDNPKGNWTPQVVADELGKILKSRDPIEAFKSSGIGKKYAKALMARKDIPPEIRAFMGEVRDGRISLSESLGNQAGIIQNLKTWRDISTDPRYFSPGPRVDSQGRQMVQLPFDKKQFGMAAGGYVDKDLWAGVQPVQKNQAGLARFLRAMTGYVKGNEVSTLRGIYNSTLGNLTSTAGMGAAGLDLQHGVSDLVMAYKALKDYHANPLTDGLGKIVHEQTTYGAHYGGVGEHELEFKKALNDLNKLYGDKSPAGSNVYDKLEMLKDVAKLPYMGVRKFHEAFGSILDANDAVFRTANYISARRYYLSKGMSLEQAARAASKDINDVFWNVQNVGKLVESARSSGAGIVARYLTAQTEDLRVWKNMAVRLATRPDTRFRVLGWGMAMGGAAAMLKAKLGPDEDLGEKDNFTKRVGSFSPLMIPLPIEEKGKRLHYDLTPHFPLARFAQGHPDDALWRRVMANILLQPVEGGAGEGPIRSFLQGTGFIRAFNPSRGPIEGDNGWRKTIEGLWKIGAVPKLPGNLINEYSKTQPRGIYPAEEGPGAAVARQLGPNIVTEPATPAPRVAEFTGEIKKLQGDLAIAAKSGRKDLIPGIIQRIKFLSQQAGAQK